MACSLHAAGMADMMVARMAALPSFQEQLHVVFLMNEIFLAG